MHIEISKVPPNMFVGVALASYDGRYKVLHNAVCEAVDTLFELRNWLESLDILPLLVSRVVNEVELSGSCILHHKGIVIRDTEWISPAAQINWANCKFPSYLKLPNSK